MLSLLPRDFPVPLGKEVVATTKESMRETNEHIREGNIIIFEAPQRKGKTLGATIWACDSFRHNRKVFSTIKFGFPYEKLDFYKLKLATDQGQSPFVNGHIFVDELNFYLDARASMSKVNRDFSAFLLQTKKQGCLMTGTTHAVKSLEMRFRDNYDYKITPSVYPKYPEKPKIIRMVIQNGPTQPRLNKVITMNCEAYLGLYDTREIYNPFSSMPTANPGGKSPSTNHARLPKFSGE